MPWSRTAGETKETYSIFIGGNAAHSDPEFTTDFPEIHFSNSPSGQFNILAGEVYQYDKPSISIAASSKGFIYNLGFRINESGEGAMAIFQQTLSGEIINISALPNHYHMRECFEEKDVEIRTVLLYEKDEILHIVSQARCSQIRELSNKTNITRYNIVEEVGSTHSECIDYNDIIDNEKVFSCGSKHNCSWSSSSLDYVFYYDNFEAIFTCGVSTSFMPMTSMQYPLKSRYTFVTTEAGVVSDPIPHSIGTNEAFLLDNHNNRLFTFISPFSQADNHFFQPGAVLPNDDMILTGKVLGPYGIDPTNYYAIYLQTSSLVYIKPIGVASISAPVSTFLLSSSAMLTCMESAGAQGIISAMNNIAHHAAIYAGFPEGAAQIVSQIFYYGSIYFMQFYLHYRQDQGATHTIAWKEASTCAATDIIVLFTVNMLLAGINIMLYWAVKAFEDRQLSKTSEILKQMGHFLQNLSYGYHIYKNSAAETTVAVVTGVATQKITEHLCHRTTASFLKTHQKSLLAIKDKNADIENNLPHPSLLNPEKRQQRYHTFSSFQQGRQKSAHTALSIYNKNKSSNASALPANDTSHTAVIAKAWTHSA